MACHIGFIDFMNKLNASETLQDMKIRNYSLVVTKDVFFSYSRKVCNS